MDPRIKALLTPEMLNTMNGLELVARILVEGYMSGSNKSQAIGTGQEFSQYRNYESGDDLRQLDWKMYARSSRYFIKQAEIETNITVKFMLDATHSMAHEEDGISKFQYAKMMTAALLYLARLQGDQFGLYLVNASQLTTLHPRFQQQQFMRFLHALAEAVPEGSWYRNGDIETLFDHHGKEMIIFISDLYDENGDLLHFISRLKTSRNEVIVFHLMGQHESTLDHQGSFSFRDLETGAIIKVDTVAQQKAYVEKVKHWIAATRVGLLEKNITYHLTSIHEPVDEVLRTFLKSRKTVM